jgi:hypothetical protein
VSAIGLIYAGAQKNIGPAGLVVVIVREDLLGKALPDTPNVLNYKLDGRADSMLNTPPTFSVYLAGLTFKWILERGGLAAIEKLNIRKAKLLYEYIDGQDFYSNPIAKEDRSRMNVPFGCATRSSTPNSSRRPRRWAVAAEGPPLRGRHARFDLQRDAARGRRGAGRVHGRVPRPNAEGPSMPSSTASASTTRSRRRAWSASRPRTTSSARAISRRRDRAALARARDRRHPAEREGRSAARAPA